ncbi:MAG: sigma-70 family RNA polymerase sigma factor [Akkermansia sp.]|nr:sigma-70 family RNA polymerase sigma factor [Akkermansia sp.]
MDKMKQMEDEEIVQLYFDRDARAISATSDKYGSYCTTVAMNILGNYEDVEECVNEAYLKTWNSIPPHRPKMLSAFLGKIVRNLSFNRRKYNIADKRGGSELTDVLSELGDCVSGNDCAEKDYEYKELVSAINDFLKELSENKRNIFVCRYYYTDKISDIAERFNMKESTISMMLGKLRTKLRNYLTRRGFGL